jgi:hypothetical protein
MWSRPSAVRFLAVSAAAVAFAMPLGGCDFAQATLPDEGPARPATLTFSMQPEYAMAGQPIGPGVAVTVLDSFGDTTFSSSASVRLSIVVGTGTLTAHLTGTTQVAAVNGTAFFEGVSIDSAGSGYRLRAEADGLGVAVSDSFTVTSQGGASPVAPSRYRSPVIRHPRS